MISDNDKTKIISLARQFKAKNIWLFGSNIKPDQEAQDIDLAVEGVDSENYFNFYGELLFNLSKPVDLVNISNDTK